MIWRKEAEYKIVRWLLNPEGYERSSICICSENDIGVCSCLPLVPFGPISQYTVSTNMLSKSFCLRNSSKLQKWKETPHLFIVNS